MELAKVYFGTDIINFDSEQGHEAAKMADGFKNELIPNYPDGKEITTVDDMHEAALQIDLLRGLRTYEYECANWIQATAHDELQDGSGMHWDQGEKYNKQIKHIFDVIPDYSVE